VRSETNNNNYSHNYYLSFVTLTYF